MCVSSVLCVGQSSPLAPLKQEKTKAGRLDLLLLSLIRSQPREAMSCGSQGSPFETLPGVWDSAGTAEHCLPFVLGLPACSLFVPFIASSAIQLCAEGLRLQTEQALLVRGAQLFSFCCSDSAVLGANALPSCHAWP